MKVEYGIINGQKPVNLVIDVNIGNEVTENKDLENFTRDEFNTFADNMVSAVAVELEGLGCGTSSYIKFPSGLSAETPVKNFDELQEAFRTDFELYKDVMAGKLKGFGNWHPVAKSKKHKRR